MSKIKTLTCVNGLRFKIIIQLFFLCYVLLSSSYVKAELSCQRDGSTTPRTGTSVGEVLEGVCDQQPGSGCVGYVTGLNFSVQLIRAASGYCYRNCGGEEQYAGSFRVLCSVDGPTYFADANGLDEERDSSGAQKESSCNPINLVTGNKYKIHTDISPKIEGSVLQKPAFTRIYNSISVVNQNWPVEKSWSHTYQRKLEFIQNFSPAVNYIGRSDAPSGISSTKQSIKYITKQQACEDGFAEIIGKAAGLSSRFLSATPVYIYGRCILQDTKGRYVTEIPIKSSVGVHRNWGDDFYSVSFPFKVKLHRPDGNAYLFQLSDSTSPSQHIYAINTAGVKGELVRNIDTSTGAVFDSYRDTINFTYTDTSEVKETYSKEGILQSISYPNGVIETLSYGATGLLDTVTNNFGHSIQFAYYADDLLETVTEGSRVWTYSYNAENLLEKVINPDLSEKNYQYIPTPQGTLLAGLIDERNIRYSSFDYYDDGLARSSYLGGNSLIKIENRSIEFGTAGGINNTVTDSRGNETSYTISNSAVKGLVTEIDTGACPTCTSKDVTYNYDFNSIDPFKHKLDILDKTEFDVLTEYRDYVSKGNPGTIIEAVSTLEEKTTTYTYDTKFKDAITSITEPSVATGNSKVTNTTYDNFGNITDYTINGFKPDGTAVTRSSTFTYAGPLNQISEYNGPRTDINDIYTFDYYPNNAIEGDNRARLKSVQSFDNIYLRNNIEYTSTGKVSAELRPNNLQIDYTYYAGNDRLKDIIQTDTLTGDTRTTHWTYLATGEVQSITVGVGSPSPSTVTLSYDDARRLTRITDGLGNYYKYVLDTEGNIEDEITYDASGTLKKTLNQTFDAYNRLDVFSQLNENQNIDFNPDGTVDTITDGKSAVNKYNYDSLKRLKSITQDQSGTNPLTANTLTQFDYDVQDNLTQVTNAKSGNTTYTYDDLGNLLSRTSPDTADVVYTHDDAGNIISAVEASGTADERSTSYSYDLYNRLTLIDAANPSDDISYTYDNCLNGFGSLCSTTTGTGDEAISIFYQYNSFGELAQTQGVQYSYDDAGRVQSMYYPSGAKVDYFFDAAGRIEQVDFIHNGLSQNLASGITYFPFGPVSRLNYNNGLSLNQTFDSAGRISNIQVGTTVDLTFPAYDANGNLQQRTNNLQALGSNNPASFTYDALNQLDTANGLFGSRDYTHDRNGNRDELIADGITTNYAYEPSSNRMSSVNGDSSAVSLDAYGNTLQQGDKTYTFNASNRLLSISEAGALKASFRYNGLGQRVYKKNETNPADDIGRHYLYGLNGQLLIETDLHGNILKEYIYLNNQLLSVFEPDSDNDGNTNAEEAIPTLANPQGTNTINADDDGDGLTNLAEWFSHGTLSSLADTDSDGVLDGTEVDLGTDPISGISFPGDGDLNHDGELNVADILLVTQIANGQRLATADQMTHGDMNLDGIINVVDVLLLQRRIFGLQVQLILQDLLKPLTTPVAELAVTEPRPRVEVQTSQYLQALAQVFNSFISSVEAVPLADGKLYYVHNNHLAAPIALTNESGLKVWGAEYDPFGLVVVDGDVEFNVRLPGQYYDGVSGLYYNYYRYYDPETGRYITSDPIGLAGGMNTYAYVRNNPLKYTDPNGLCGLPCVIGGIGIGVGYLIFRDDVKESAETQSEINNIVNEMMRNDMNGLPQNPNLDVDGLIRREFNSKIDPLKSGADLDGFKGKHDNLKSLIDINKILKQCD